jgi:endonuclease III
MASRKKPDPKRTVKLLLSRYENTFAEEVGIELAANTRSGLFCWLTAALLFSARIGHPIALKSARMLMQHGWTTPEKLARATWEQRVKALDEGGYVRYDERTSTMLGQAAEMLVEQYSGDLRKLREAAERDPRRERKLLKEFKGIGEVGANIFFREAQLAWPELFPFADGRVLAAAAELGLPEDARKLAKLVRGRHEFARLVAALIRVGLQRRYEEIRSEAAGGGARPVKN